MTKIESKDGNLNFIGCLVILILLLFLAAMTIGDPPILFLISWKYILILVSGITLGLIIFNLKK